jgi:hypothetical protein
MKKLVYLFISLLLTTPVLTQGQNNNCQKLIVGIYLTDLEDNLISILNKKYGTKSRMEWIDEIDAKVLNILQSSCPEIQFFSRVKDKSSDPDYIFNYSLWAIAIDTKILIPSDSICYDDPTTGSHTTEYTDPVYDSEPGILMISRLVVNSPCHPVLRWILAAEFNKSLELEQTIHENLISYYSMINIIEEH